MHTKRLTITYVALAAALLGLFALNLFWGSVAISPRGVVQAPPSKSMAHRMLLCAGLAEGESVVHNVAFSEDILATIDVLRAIGATCRIDGDTVTVTGADERQEH